MDNYQLVVGTEDCPLNTVVTILRPSTAIQNEWSAFARRLGVPSEQIRRLRQELLLNKIIYEDLLYEVLETWIGKRGSEATLANLLQVVEGDSGANDVGEILRLEYKLPCKEAEGNSSIGWNDLSPAFQIRVTETFQQFTPNLKHAEVLPKLSGAALVSLMQGRKPHALSLPGKPSYYVSRTVVTRNLISDKIFDQDSSDIFLFTGMTRYELSKLAKAKLTGSSRQQLHSKVNVRFMTLDQQSHFERICGKTKHPVHLLKMEVGGRLTWIKSNGEMGNLRKYVDPKQDELDEGQFCQMSISRSFPVLILDSPGMGKSTLLAEIGHRLLRLHPGRTVLFIVLSEFIKLAKSFGMENNIDMIERTLQERTGEALPESKLNSEDETVSIELLLDGYDEVDSADRKLALEVLQTISKSFKYIRLWVTSRPHLMGELENSLNVLGYNIRPFHEENQVHFLTSFWTRKVELDQEKVQLFAKRCLKSLKATMNSTDHDIAGIPLQCLLIGEVYEDDAVEYANPDNEDVSSSSLEIVIGTIANLYRQLIKKKFDKYQSAFGNTKWSQNDLMTIHSHLSLETFFPDEHGNLGLTKAGEIDIDEVMKAGILTSTPMGEVTLMHRTLAEYFVAWFISDKLQQEEEWTPHLLNLFFRTMSCSSRPSDMLSYEMKFTHPVICYFLNSMMADLQIEILPNHFPPEFNDLLLSKIHAIAMACIEGDYDQIFKLFDMHGALDKLPSNVFNLDLLLSAVRNSSAELVKSVLVHFERHHNFDLEAQKVSLREAVRSGKFSTLEFLLKEKELSGLVTDFDKKINLVCDCVKGTMDCSDEEINERIQVLQMLVGIKGCLVDGPNGSSIDAPLHSRQGHVKLRTELLRLGANPFVQNKQGDSVLHLSYITSIFQMSREDYHRLLLSIHIDNLKKMVHVEGESRDTALMSILRKFDPLAETLDTFHELGADFNHVSKNGDSLLVVAIKNGRNSETIRKLIQLGADVNGIDEQRNTPLHVLAQFTKTFSPWYRHRHSIIQYLIENGANLGALNNLNETPFHSFLKNDDGDFKTFRLFKSIWDEECLWTPTIASLALAYVIGGNDAFPDLELIRECEAHGADFNWLDDKGNSLLHLAVKNGKGNTVSFLCKNNKCIDINSKNNMGQSPLQMAASSKDNACLEVITCLIENGANPMEITIFGESILHFAALGSAEALKYFLELGRVDINGKDMDGDTPLHYVVVRGKGENEIGYLENCRLLIQYGADVNMKNRERLTPLDLAMMIEDDELLDALLVSSCIDV